MLGFSPRQDSHTLDYLTQISIPTCAAPLPGTPAGGAGVDLRYVSALLPDLRLYTTPAGGGASISSAGTIARRWRPSSTMARIVDGWASPQISPDAGDGPQMVVVAIGRQISRLPYSLLLLTMPAHGLRANHHHI